MSVMPWRPTDNLYLLIGQHIEIRENDKLIDSGRVEETTEDGLILWLAMDGPRERRLIEIAPGRDLKIHTNGGGRGTAP